MQFWGLVSIIPLLLHLFGNAQLQHGGIGVVKHFWEVALCAPTTALFAKPPSGAPRARVPKTLRGSRDRQFTPDDRVKYEESLKYYRDLKNVVDTSFEEGKAEGIAEGLTAGKEAIARQMKSEGEAIEKIIRYTGLYGEAIEKL